MNRKKFLSSAVLVILFVGVGLSFVPLMSSLGPSAKAEAALARIDISNLEEGELIFMVHPNYGESIRDYNWGVMIYKRYDGSLLAYDVPMKRNSVGLPDLYWWQPAWECFNFGPSKTNGLVDEGEPIKCHDTHRAKSDWFPDLEWNINGESIKGGMKDMLHTKGVIEGNHFVFGKRS